MTTAPSTIDISTRFPGRERLTVSEGWYLLNVYLLAPDGEETVRMGTLADRLDVEPASVTGMATKLADAELCTYERYDGIGLTARGRDVAESLAWRQCVVRAYFDRALSYAMDGFTAYRIGVILPDDGLDYLQDSIDHPCTGTCRGIPQGYDGCQLEVRT